ncbi:hypothetical protein KW801_01925 [Candidatus Saccharibacteria bacterium]|nr:hypothetical protein [Candidatus Saccharibacteria bacterium]
MSYIKLATSIMPEQLIFIGPFYTQVRRDRIKEILEYQLEELNGQLNLGDGEGIKLVMENTDLADTVPIDPAKPERAIGIIRQQYDVIYKQF